MEQSERSQERRLGTLRPGVGEMHNPDRTFNRLELRMVLRTRTRARLARSRSHRLGGGNAEDKGHHGTSAARQVPKVFLSARIDVPHKRY